MYIFMHTSWKSGSFQNSGGPDTDPKYKGSYSLKRTPNLETRRYMSCKDQL